MVKRKTITTFVAVTASAVATYAALPHLNHWLLTGRLFPVNVVERLDSPSSVRGWSEDSVSLADGRTVKLPGFRRLPKISKALSEATKRGVEITPDGRVVGLVRVHHWCGNDPVGEHVARVDLSLMLAYLQEGERLTPLSEDEKKLIPPHFSDEFSDYGWRVGEFGRFKMWCDYVVPTSAAQENDGSLYE